MEPEIIDFTPDSVELIRGASGTALGLLAALAVIGAWRGYDLAQYNEHVECQKRAAHPEFVRLLTLSPDEAARLATPDAHHRQIGSAITRYLQMQGRLDVIVTVVSKTSRADSDSLTAARASKYANNQASLLAIRIDHELEQAAEQYRDTAITTVPTISNPSSARLPPGTTLLTISGFSACSSGTS